MYKMKTMNVIAVLQFVILLMLSNYSLAQTMNGIPATRVDSTNTPKIDTSKKDFYLKGGVNITNKGISYIPNFSIGKPAIIIDLSMGSRKLFFEPQLRFSLNGEPWAFLFPVRYKLKFTGKFQMIIGVNPLMNFKTVTYTVNGISITDLVNRRYLGGELKPNYFITENTSVGANYLYFRGVSDRALANTNFVSVNVNFSYIKLVGGFFSKLSTQIYYLNQDGKDGFYFSPVVTLLKKRIPFSIQSVMNATIHSIISGNQKFIWNVSLIYTFNKAYTEKLHK
jgi:hypothetical protein